MTAPIQTVHIVRQGIAGPPGSPGPAGADSIFTDIATQADAEAGVDNIKGMTPLRVQQKVTLDLNAAVAGLVDSAPSALDTLNKLASALGGDPNFAAATAAALDNRLRVDAVQTFEAAEKTQAQSNIGLVVGADVQAYSATLASLAGLALAADKLPYATAANTLALADLTAAGRAMIGAADAAAQLALLTPIENASLANSSVTLAGLALSLGGAITAADLKTALALSSADNPTFNSVTVSNNQGLFSTGGQVFIGGTSTNTAPALFISSALRLASTVAIQFSAGTTGNGTGTFLKYNGALGAASLGSTNGGDDGVLSLGNLILNNVPTADPHVLNALWLNGGVFTLSAG